MDSHSGKLTVILHADVAGSTRLVQQDEHLAHQRIRDSFNRFGDHVHKYQGRVLEIRGDALLAEFERASDAVSAALSFQQDQAIYLQALEEGPRPSLRVGIALGEVVIADSTATGAGVVLAQRVEQLAEAGGVCITSAIHEALPRRLPFRLENLGDQNLKGFDEPVRVFGVSLDSGHPVPPPQSSVPAARPAKSRKIILLSGAVIFIGLAYLVYTFAPGQPREEAASMDRMAYPLPDVPSIAVLPFANLSDSSEQEYFADGITEDLIADLSKVSGLFVIARNSSFSYKEQQVKVRQVAEELGVRYVLEGNVRRAGDQVRINAKLIDASTGGHLWAEKYDGTLADVFALQDQVTRKIVDALAVTLTLQESQSIGSTGSDSVEAHDAYLQGLSFYLRNTPADNAKAETYFLRAIELDPRFSRAHAALAKVYYKGAEPEYSRALGIYYRKAILLAYRHLQHSEGAGIAGVNVVQSLMALFKHQLGVALYEADQALSISANDVDAMKAKARALIYSGQYEKGRQLAHEVMRQDPVAIAEPRYLIGLSYFATGDYQLAAESLELALESDPDTSMYTRVLAATYGRLGRLDEASRAWLRFRKNWHWPVWIAAEITLHPFQDDAVLQQLAAGFKAAGVAERPPAIYIPLDRDSRLTADEIESLLFGHTIRGTDFYDGTSWQQERDRDGSLVHTGPWFYSGNTTHSAGESRVKGDLLCDRWLEDEGGVTICVTIYRDVVRGEGNYLMVNDRGPHPFRVVTP